MKISLIEVEFSKKMLELLILAVELNLSNQNSD